MNDWKSEWNSKDYQLCKKENFKTIDDYLSKPPIRILDIGCGLAFESELFQKKYGSELYLLDGDADLNEGRTRDVNFGEVGTFCFYNFTTQLRESYDERKMNYKFIDATNIVLSESIVFDLVYSNLSCGFHYPFSTYKNLISKHTTESSIIIIDIRKKNFKEQSQDFEIISTVREDKKYKKVQIKIH